MPWAMWRGFGNSYGYNRNEHPDNILSNQEVIRMVIDVVADNGNIEFNIGPKADGTLAEFEYERLAAMGAWLKKNGEAIYGAKKSPVGSILPDGRLTHKPDTNTLYYHVYNWPEDGALLLPGILSEITAAKILLTGEALNTNSTRKGVEITVPENAPDPDATVITLTYEGELKSKMVPQPKKKKR